MTNRGTIRRVKEAASAVVRSILATSRSPVSADQLGGVAERIDQMMTRLQVVENSVLNISSVTEQKKRELRLAGLIARSLRNTAPKSFGPRPLPKSDGTLDPLVRLRKLNPVLFDDWYRLFMNGAEAYSKTVIGNCSHREHEFALLFGQFIDLYGRGQILDLGCGPYDLPSYLASFDRDQISGLEPLPSLVEPSFQVVRGFGEFIPWADESFDTVVSGASLDHVLSLNKALEEIHRVLKPRGRFLLWVASIEGAKEFEEQATHYDLIDDFHVFHFDRIWLEPRLEKSFHFIDTAMLQEGGYFHMFYCLERR